MKQKTKKTGKKEIQNKIERLSNLREETITQFMKNNSNVELDLNENHKMKLCSSDYFSDTIFELSKKHENKISPIVISHVGGFYETASLAGKLANTNKNRTKPHIIFFDREINNMQNAIYNTLLMKISGCKEEYIAKLLSLKPADVLKAVNNKLYLQFAEKAYDEISSTSSPIITEDAVDKYIEKNNITKELMQELYQSKNYFNKLKKFVNEYFHYNPEEHFKFLLKDASKKLKGDVLKTFTIISQNVCDYLKKDNNYNSLIEYLARDLKSNEEHILNSDETFESYKSLIYKNGSGYVKFLPGIDLSKEEDLEKFKQILRDKDILNEEDKQNFSMDIAVIPHIEKLKNVHHFLKNNVQYFTVANRSSKRIMGDWSYRPSATLHIRTMESIGAEKIKEARESRIPLTNVQKIEPLKGFPVISFMAGADFGNIYHSEVDTFNFIDLSIAHGTKVFCLQGGFYPTFFHHQTSRRFLNDPTYETLDSRLKMLKNVRKKVTDSGAIFIYQMGDEEIHLYHDIFKIYLREQNVKYSDYLARQDLRTKHDWVRPIIIQQLIPYMIRSGKDIINFYTDEEEKTRVTEICGALDNINTGAPLGDLEEYILDLKYLEDTDTFKVVFETEINFDKDDPAITLKYKRNSNFSYNTNYGTPEAGLKKYTRLRQMGAIGETSLEDIPQLIVDSRQAYMGMEVMNDQIALNVSSMIDDSLYDNPDLLPGLKDIALECPTHKRMTQAQLKPNSIGGWTHTGDIRYKYRVIPYFKRTREVLNYVQKTGEGLPRTSILNLNDWQLGSITERPMDALKMIDYAFYNYPLKGIIGNGDYQQGWNYPGFADENKHLGSMSVSQQMVSFVKMLEPWHNNAFGVIQNNIFGLQIPQESIKYYPELVKKQMLRELLENPIYCEEIKFFMSEHSEDEFEITSSMINDLIISHLLKNDIIKIQKGRFGINYAIKDFDYKTVNLNLPNYLEQYEDIIRNALIGIRKLEFYHLVEGNHEYNTDWNHKGYRLIEHIKQALDDLKKNTGSDIDIKLSEYFVNEAGHFVHAPFGSFIVNGYNSIYSHVFKCGGKGSGQAPLRNMANYLEQMGSMSFPFHRAQMAHLHIVYSGVIDNMLLNITGAFAGQSGYEQALGYYSPGSMGTIDTYTEDGEIITDIISKKFLDDWPIKNPEVAKIGLENFINNCNTQEATIFGSDTPRNPAPLFTRKLIMGEPSKIIGPKIPLIKD